MLRDDDEDELVELAREAPELGRQARQEDDRDEGREAEVLDDIVKKPGVFG